MDEKENKLIRMKFLVVLKPGLQSISFINNNKITIIFYFMDNCIQLYTVKSKKKSQSM